MLNCFAGRQHEEKTSLDQVPTVEVNPKEKEGGKRMATVKYPNKEMPQKVHGFNIARTGDPLTKGKEMH